VRCGSSLRK